MSVARRWRRFRLRRLKRGLPRSSPAKSAPPVAIEPAEAEAKLPEFAKKAVDLEALKKAVDDAASVSGGLWFSYLFMLTYLAVAAGAVTHADLFFEKPISLLFINVNVRVVAFFALAPLLFLALHVYTLVSLVMLTEKTKRFHNALYQQIGETLGMSAEGRRKRKEARDGLRAQLPSNVFVQFLAGPPAMRGGPFGWALRAIGWITLAIGSALLLLLFQVQFLPYHSGPITWMHRLALLVDLSFVWWLWRRILEGRELEDKRSALSWGWAPIGIIVSVAVVLFSLALATYRGEGIAIWLASRDYGAVVAAVHETIFQSQVNPQTRLRAWLLSDTLVLPRVNALEELKTDDLERENWKDYIFIAQDRDLVGADFSEAIIARIDFRHAILRGADFQSARMDRVSFDDAQLQGASLDRAQLQGTSFVAAHLEGASLADAHLEGASLVAAHLEGASLIRAQLQGALLLEAQLQGVSLSRARLQGALLENAKLQGASLVGALLLGASFNGAILDAADLSFARLWRSSGDASRTENLDLTTGAPDVWGPFFASPMGVQRPWDKAAYTELRNEIEALPAGPLRDQALARIQTLDCDDTTRVSCDPGQALNPPAEFAKWRNQLVDAKVEDAVFRRALTNSLRVLICPGDEETLYVVRGAGLLGRLRDAGSEGKSLLDDLREKSGNACPVAAQLNDDDRAKLPEVIKTEATAPAALTPK